MINRFKKLALLAFFVVGGSTLAQAQNQVDLLLNASVSNGGVFPGVNYTGTLDVVLTSFGFVNLPSGSFRINITLPTGLEFSPTFNPGPNWTYLRTTATSARLTPTADVVPLALGGAPYSFQVPFLTVAEIDPALTFSSGDIINLSSGFYNDPVSANNQPTSTVFVGGTPLPVQFASFEAKANGCDVNLNWITSNEKENAYFNVERSANGTKFETIDKVASQGNSSNAKRYNFVDANPLTGKSFYRISQVDIDGKSTSTKMEPVNVNCMVSTIEMYPNPATDFINVKGMQSGINTVRVINVAGQVVAEEVAEVGQQQVNIAKLASGTYQVQVLNNDQVVFTGKFVKAK